jgi:hypothetical protein
MSISTVKGCLTPEVTSSVDRATTVFKSCFVDIYRLSCTVSTLLAFLLLPKMVERRFRPRGACQTGSDVTVRFLDPDLVLIVFGILRLFLTDQKLFDFFDLHVKCPLKIRGKGTPPEKTFSSMSPRKGTSFWQTTSFEA